MSEPVTIGDATLYQGDAEEILPTLAAASVDAVVTDPPAGIGFMGKKWDHDKGGRDQWILWMTGVAVQCLRVLKPGGHALVWALPRTSHWTATAWENAGFEVRDRIIYCFGSGFPKSLDVSKAIDKAAGAERKILGRSNRGARNKPHGNSFDDDAYEWQAHYDITAPTTPAARQWSGWGTALKPAVEDWWLLRKPLGEPTVAANVLAHGTGGLNIDGCRVGTETRTDSAHRKKGPYTDDRTWSTSNTPARIEPKTFHGRWPANVCHDGSEEVVGLFPQTGKSAGGRSGHERAYGGGYKQEHYGDALPGFGDSGSAARFFYTAKASKADRDEGLGELAVRPCTAYNFNDDPSFRNVQGRSGDNKGHNHHPTVKPTALMRWLCRLVTPPGGIVLDPFMGSGSTGKACAKEGFRFVGIELDADYFEIAKRRIEHAMTGGPLLAEGKP